MRKIISFLLIILFLTASTITLGSKLSSETKLSGTTYYVGGTGSGNYTKIQDAIDAASDGDTVFVYSGFYQENLILDKSIKLHGEDKDTTVIDGNKEGNVIKVDVDFVRIKGFTIQNGKYGIILYSSSNNMITGNNISDNNRVLYLICTNNTYTLTNYSKR